MLELQGSPVLIPEPLGVTVNLTFDEGVSAIFSDRGPSEILNPFGSVTVALRSFVSTVGVVSPLRSRWGDQRSSREVKGAAVSDLRLKKEIKSQSFRNAEKDFRISGSTKSVFPCAKFPRQIFHPL